MSPLEIMLHKDEGCRLTVYMDSLGNPTIGYGHLLKDKDNFPIAITQEQADAILASDIVAVTKETFTALPWCKDMDPIRQAALLNMAFNMGVRTLLSFRLTLAALKSQAWEDAAELMLKSLWAHEVGDRAIRLSEVIKTGSMESYS